MARKPADPDAESKQERQDEDTALLSLSRTDRRKLNMDAWEPSLLRKLLTAQNRLRKRD
ncbi:MAG TPA: hypothetical protein VMR74_11765 [Gammaproteobacteria bacterium]|nr:hypothetical protein [Gammaproteobacteria bacterium]